VSARLIGAALLAALSVPLAAQAAPQAAPTVDAARMSRGVTLARMLNSEAMTRVQMERVLSQTLPNALNADASFSALEKEHPGISAAMIEAMRPIVVDGLIKTLPVAWERIGAVFAEELTAAELDQAIAFYASATGSRVLEGMTREADFSKVMQEMLAGKNGKVNEASLHWSVSAGAVKAVQQLSPEDRRRLVDFGWSAAGAKLNATNRRVMAIVTAWSNEDHPEVDAQMEKAMIAVSEKFLSQDVEQ
jgi:hypothetical protein